ncbi:Subtilisin-like protease, fibronectin type-III domain [Dillenia turbinata]|uniref:Subtilisin-like protease, fibronectin type-III domain n=1 Tax=Dillenia turbinata TaxID=194707 RepID=A0AAN8VP35_9MAGN
MEKESNPNSSNDPKSGVNVTVNPTSLDFTEVNQKKIYAVTSGRANGNTPTAPFSQGFQLWPQGDSEQLIA